MKYWSWMGALVMMPTY
ncbi:hypothetical protein [Escherichia coli]